MSDIQLAGVEQLFTPMKRRYKTVDLPVSGLTVRIQSLTEREVADYQQEAFKKSGNGLIPARLRDSGPRLIVRCVVDASGNRIMNASNVPQLLEWDSADSNCLQRACMDHCGIRDDENLDGLVKNSETTGGDD